VAKINSGKGALFNADASFKALKGLAGSGVTFRSYNKPQFYLAHDNFDFSYRKAAVKVSIKKVSPVDTRWPLLKKQSVSWLPFNTPCPATTTVNL